jgi:hypothetical protein
MRLERLLVAIVVLSSAACDPCAGVLDCRVDPALRVEGRLVDVVSGRSASGVRVAVTSAGTTIATNTNQEGLFDLEVPVSTTGSIEYDLAVSLPGDSTFTAPAQLCKVTAIRGSGCPLGLVVTRPYFPDISEIWYRGGRDIVLVPGAATRFDRQSGVHFYGANVSGGSIAGSTDGAGRIATFGLDVYSTEVGEAVGRLVVALPPPLDSGWTDSAHFASTFEFRAVRPLRIFRVGPSVDATYRFVDQNGPIEGADVTLRRTGGIPAASESVAGRTDSEGNVVLGLRPLTRGTMVVQLTVSAPAPNGSFTTGDVPLTTREDDTAPLAGTWNVTTGIVVARRGPMRR